MVEEKQIQVKLRFRSALPVCTHIYATKFPQREGKDSDDKGHVLAQPDKEEKRTHLPEYS